MDDNDHIDETAAADSIAGHGVVSRSELLAQMLSATASIPTPALVDFCAKALAFANDPGAKHGGGAPGASDSNKASIAMKASAAAPGQPGMPLIQAVREDLDVVLAAQDLPAEAVEKLLTLFESAVNARVNLHINQLAESQDQKLAEEATELVEEIDQVIDYATAKFYEDNALVIENELKIDLYEDFLAGLAELFRQHWVEVPEDKLDVLDSLASRVSDLEEALNDKTSEVLALEDQLLSVSARRVFDAVSEDMTEVDRSKLQSLSESVEFDGDEDQLRQRLETIREAHFKKPGAVSEKRASASVLTEGEVVTVELNKSEAGNSVIESAPPEVRPYAETISRLARRTKL